MSRFSILKKQIENLFEPELKAEFCCYAYPMRSQRGSTSIPRFCVKLDGEIIWDCPKEFKIPEQFIHVWSGNNNVNDLVRDYIDAPVNGLLQNQFENETFEYENYKITYGLTDIFKALDRRLGKEKLCDWALQIHNTTIYNILLKRFKKDDYPNGVSFKENAVYGFAILSKQPPATLLDLKVNSLAIKNQDTFINYFTNGKGTIEEARTEAKKVLKNIDHEKYMALLREFDESKIRIRKIR